MKLPVSFGVKIAIAATLASAGLLALITRITFQACGLW